MDVIPIHDATVPIACTAGAEEIHVRMAQVERLRAALQRVERTEHGLLLHFPNRDDLDAELRRFTSDEKGCCRFWGFDIQRGADHLRLRWDGPPAAQELLDRLLGIFEGDGSIAELPGLL